MTVSQISVFTESKPGHLARTLSMFENAGLNVRGYSVSDTGEYGIARFIVDDPERAMQTLKKAGCAFTSSDVLCVKLKDTPGELAKVMQILADNNMNISYSYSMISTYIIISTDSLYEAKEIFEKTGIETIGQSALQNIAH